MIFGHFFCLLTILIDQLVKWLFIHNGSSDIIKYIKIPFLLSITPSWNAGISFGLFSNLHYASNLILVINTLVIGQIYKIAIRKNEKSLFCYFTILAGAISNCVDRVLNDAVFDFINFCPGGKTYVIFNLSDVLVFFGIVWLLFNKIRGK